MSSPMEKLKQAKEMLDMGAIDQAMFEQIRNQVMTELGMNTQTPSSPPPPPQSNPLGGSNSTMVGGASPFAQASQALGGNPLGGNPLGGNPLGGNPLGGNPLGGAGATMVGAASSPEASNLLGVSGEEEITIGNFHTLRKLGAGGMGAVYIARHNNENLAKTTGDVALKLIHNQFSQDPSFRKRFINEAGLGIKINHKNIARVYELIDTEQHLGFAMELIEGEELEERISPEGDSLEAVLQYLEPLASALDHLHSQGIAHRDFKPENVKITASGKPVILDFGIALVQSEGDARQTQALSRRVNRAT